MGDRAHVLIRQCRAPGRIPEFQGQCLQHRKVFVAVHSWAMRNAIHAVEQALQRIQVHVLSDCVERQGHRTDMQAILEVDSECA